MGRGVGAGQQRVQRRLRLQLALAHLHRGEGAVLAAPDVAAPELQMPARERAHTGQSVFVVAPMLPRQRDVASIDGETLVGGEVTVSFRHLTKEPGTDQRRARRHHTGTAGAGAQRLDLVTEQHIAVPDDRDGDRRRNGRDRIPVGSSPVARVAGAAVHGDCVRAGVSDGPGLVQCVTVVVVPPQPDLRRDGNLRDRLLHRLDQAPLPVRLTAE